MTREDVNRMFTEKVTELIAQGYQINAGTMPGSQGEIAKVDFRKGSEIIRVMLEHRCDFGTSYGDFFCITVGRWAEPLRENWDDTIWNNRLEPISEIKLAKITNNYFVTPEEAIPMAEKRNARWRAQNRFNPLEVALGDAYKSIALRYIQRQPRMKGCKLDDVEKVARVRYKGELVNYKITARGKAFYLRANKA